MRFSGSSEMLRILSVAFGAAPPPGVRVEGSPVWPDQFQITAKRSGRYDHGTVPADVAESAEGPDGAGIPLVEKRKSMPYTLVVAKGGLKLKRAAVASGLLHRRGAGQNPLHHHRCDEDKYPICCLRGIRKQRWRGQPTAWCGMTIRHSSINCNCERPDAGNCPGC